MKLERAKGFEPERALHANNRAMVRLQRLEIGAGEGIRTLDPDLGKVILHGCHHYPCLRYVAIYI